MSADQTPEASTEQELVEAILARLVTVSRLPRWMQAPALGRDMTPLAELVASALAPLIEREREAAAQQWKSAAIETHKQMDHYRTLSERARVAIRDARDEGMAAVAGPVVALDKGHGEGCRFPDVDCVCSVPLFDLRSAIPTDAAEALARVRAEAKAEALREAAHHYGVIWGSGLTTEEQVAGVLKHWAEHGIGAHPLDVEKETKE